MSDMYSQGSGSKKKFLAPVIVMLLCMTSLTVAGYAYNATVTNTDDQIIVDGLTMELYDTAATPALVTAPMYSVSDIHIATHTTNGYALKYGANGFYADPAEHSGSTYGPETETAIADDFKPGYYVEVIKDTTSVGVKALDEVADFADADAIDDAVAAGKLIQIDGVYTLKVNNQVMDASKDVKVSLNAKWKDELTAFGGLVGVYVVVMLGDDLKCVEKVGTNDDFTVIESDLGADITSYTIKAYVALTDYYSATAPEDIGGDGATGFFNEKFYIAFNAETVATA